MLHEFAPKVHLPFHNSGEFFDIHLCDGNQSDRHIKMFARIVKLATVSIHKIWRKCSPNWTSDQHHRYRPIVYLRYKRNSTVTIRVFRPMANLRVLLSFTGLYIAEE